MPCRTSKEHYSGQAVESERKATSEKEGMSMISAAIELPITGIFRCAVMASSILEGHAAF